MPRRPALDRSAPSGQRVARMTLVGINPMTSSPAGRSRASYVRWLAALDDAARRSAQTARSVVPGMRFELRLELRLWVPNGECSDLDNYVKPIQDKLASHGIFGATEHAGSTMTGDEHIDRLDVRRVLVETPGEAGVLADVWALTSRRR